VARSGGVRREKHRAEARTERHETLRGRAEVRDAGGGQERRPAAGWRDGTPPRAAQVVKAAPAELDRLIHERIRLGIVSALAVSEALTFNDLKKILRTTDGNLSVHARKLEDAQYIVCSKSFEGRLPKTEYRLTAAGRRALERYLGHMEALIQATRSR
jgi:DNA-binding MarR family transcriptional regulator